jgi:hypothetical protein
LKKRRDIIINYDTRDDYYVRTHVKNTPVTTITIYVYRKELFDRERVARIDIIILSPIPQILGNEPESEELRRGVYERVR